MITIIVATDFSASARNALTYACELTNNFSCRLVLLHITPYAGTYSSEGIALAGMNDVLENATVQINEEAAWARESYPHLIVSGRVEAGRFLHCLQEVTADEHAVGVIMGATNFDEVWQWDRDILGALTDIQMPVAVIPEHVKYRPLKNIGWACRYAVTDDRLPLNEIKQLMSFTKAHLHVINVITDDDKDKVLNEAKRKNVQDALGHEQVSYHDIKGNRVDYVIDSLRGCVKELELDAMIIIPREHGILYKLIHRSNTKDLARMNILPILALHNKR